jgi:hypothetical protein
MDDAPVGGTSGPGMDRDMNRIEGISAAMKQRLKEIRQITKSEQKSSIVPALASIDMRVISSLIHSVE